MDTDKEEMEVDDVSERNVDEELAESSLPLLPEDASVFEDVSGRVDTSCSDGDALMETSQGNDLDQELTSTTKTAQTRPPRRVAMTIKRKLKRFLKELENDKIITKSWVSNRVIIEKAYGSLQICLDPMELNMDIRRPYFEVPTIRELSTKLSGQKVYTVLDFKSGFRHCELREESAEACTFSTPYRCYQWNRLPFRWLQKNKTSVTPPVPENKSNWHKRGELEVTLGFFRSQRFGLTSSPEHFMAEVAKHFGDLEGVTSYCDDIIVTGKTYEEHDKILIALMKRAEEKNFVGYIFNKEGRHIDPNRISAIIKMKAPEKKEQVQNSAS
ncbi:hypothetical protein FOCC_FOCC002256, partial [Frankliniella occidentalis]